MGKERKVTFTLEVAAAGNNKRAIADFRDDLESLDTWAKRAGKSMSELAAAQTKASRPTAAAASRRGADPFAAGLERMKTGSWNAGIENLKRESVARQQSLEQEKSILRERVTANLEANRRIREDAMKSQAANVKSRDLADQKRYGTGKAISDDEAFKHIQALSREQDRADRSRETSARRVAATQTQAARSTLADNVRMLSGVRQIGSAFTQASRAAIFFAASNEESAQKMLKMVLQAEALVGLFQSASSLGGGLAKILSSGGSLAMLANPYAVGGLAVAGAGYAAYRGGRAIYDHLNPAPNRTHAQFSDDVAGYAMGAAARGRSQASMTGGMDQYIGIRNRSNVTNTLLGRGLSGTSLDLAENQAEIIRYQQMKHSAYKEQSGFDFNAVGERYLQQQRVKHGANIDDADRGIATSAAVAARAEMMTRTAANEKLASENLLRLTEERFQLVQREHRERTDIILEERRGLMDAIESEKKRIDVIRERTMSVKERFGNMEPEEQQKHLAVFKRYQLGQNIDRKDRDSLYALGLNEAAQGFAAKDADKGGFKRVENELNKDIPVGEAAIKTLREGVQKNQAAEASLVMEAKAAGKAYRESMGKFAGEVVHAFLKEVQLKNDEENIKTTIRSLLGKAFSEERHKQLLRDTQDGT